MPKSSRSSSHSGAVVVTILYRTTGKSLIRGSTWSNDQNIVKMWFVTKTNSRISLFNPSLFNPSLDSPRPLHRTTHHRPNPHRLIYHQFNVKTDPVMGSNGFGHNHHHHLDHYHHRHHPSNQPTSSLHHLPPPSTIRSLDLERLEYYGV